MFVQKCNNPPCQCQVSHGTRIDWSGRHFCSHYCVAYADERKERCHCGHKECEPKKEK
jgi:hypothetical protein